MTPELKKLLRYLNKTKNKSFKKIAQLSSGIEITNVEEVSDESIQINVNEMLSLIDPKAKITGNPQIGLVALENNNQISSVPSKKPKN
jgi:type IV secretory pathway TrbF-like protein